MTGVLFEVEASVRFTGRGFTVWLINHFESSITERFHVYEETRFLKIIMKTKQSQREDTDEEYTVWYKIVFIGIQ